MDKSMLIKDIFPNAEGWSCKITVQEKQQVISSPGTPTKRQKFIFFDPEGSQVEGIIFNNDIARMSPILQVYKSYLISNAIVRPIPTKFQTEQLKIQWLITSRTVVEPLADDEAILPIKFNYTPFADLANYMDDKGQSVDILAVVIKGFDVRSVSKNGKNSTVQKFVIINQRQQTVILSLWDGFVAAEGARIMETLHNYPVIVCRRLKVNFYNGVALSTWFDSAILVEPPIREAIDLKHWARQNNQSLQGLINDQAYLKYDPAMSLGSDQRIAKIISVKSTQKTAWIKAQFSFEHILQKYWYMGCSKCFRSTAASHGVVFTCNSCKERHPAQPRCRYDVDLTDSTGSITASIFGDLAERLLSYNAQEAMDHYNQNIELPLQHIHAELKQKPFLVHIKPAQTQLTDSRQRFTVIYYCDCASQPSLALLDCQENDDHSSHCSKPQNFEAASLGVEPGSSSKARLCLDKKLAIAPSEPTTASEISDADCAKKIRLS